MTFEMPNFVKELITASPPSRLANLLHDVFFDSYRDVTNSEIKAVIEIIKSRDDASECVVALDVCKCAMEENQRVSELVSSNIKLGAKN